MKIKMLAAAAAIIMAAQSISVSAETGEKINVNIESGYAQENSKTDVVISFDNNPGISAYSIEISYDPQLLAFDSAKSLTSGKNETFYCNGKYSSGSIKAVWSSSMEDDADGGALQLTFKTKSETAEKTSAVDLESCQFGNKDLSQINYEISGGEVKITGEINSGDADLNGIVEIGDLVTLNKYLLDNASYPLKSNTAEANCDMDLNGKLEMSDSAYLINRLCELV
jgi:hypothetical protein